MHFVFGVSLDEVSRLSTPFPHSTPYAGSWTPKDKIAIYFRSSSGFYSGDQKVIVMFSKFLSDER